MKFQIMLKILFRLLRKRKLCAKDLAAENGVSERSIYRYVEELIISGVPIDIIRGRNGGICLPDTYRLPENFFSKEEFAAAVNALNALSEQLPDKAIRSALEKLTLQQKQSSRDLTISGNILVDSGTWGDAYGFSDTLKFMEQAIENCRCLDITYLDRSGTQSRRIIEPHLLIYKQNIWYVYAFCRRREDFRLFRVARIRGASDTGECFEKRPFDRDNLPLKFNFTDKELIDLRILVQKEALPDVEEWLGVGNIHLQDGRIYAEAVLPQGEPLLSKLLSFGDTIKIERPKTLSQELTARAKRLAALYDSN